MPWMSGMRNLVRIGRVLGGIIMSEHGHCHDCGGSDGHHYNDCMYDGTNSTGGYHHRSSDMSAGAGWLIYIVAMIIGYAINELLGCIILGWLVIRYL